MRAVRGPGGDPVLVVEHAPDRSRICDPREGACRTVPTDDLAPVEGDPLAAVGRAILGAAGPLPVAGDAAAGVLADLESGPRSVRRMLDAYGLCESDLHGLLAELAAADLVAETTAGGRRGYELTEDARVALRR